MIVLRNTRYIIYQDTTSKSLSKTRVQSFTSGYFHNFLNRFMAFNYKKKWTRALRLMDTPIEKKPTATGELALFAKIALARSVNWKILAKHRDFDWKECEKWIKLEDLSHWNFSHDIPKSRWEEYRLDPKNITIVSVAWHTYEHSQQILKVHYKN